MPDFDKAIWLDGDTLILNDLAEMFNVDMEGYCYKGFLDFSCYRKHLKELCNVDTDHYICDGVMLVNLNELRKENSIEKFKDFIEDCNAKSKKLEQHDQTVINAVFCDKIGVLPAKFAIWNQPSNWYVEFEKLLISPEKYTVRELINAHDNPTVLHCTCKPWIWPEFASDAQLWWEYAEKTDIFDKIKKKYLISDGIYEIASALNSNKVLDIEKSSKKDGAKLQLWEKNNTNAQRFKITYDKDGYYTIKSLCSGKMIDVQNSSNEPGVSLWQYSNNDTNAQKWYILPNKDGTYRIISKCNGMNIDVTGSKAKNGTKIQCWPANNTDAQNFKFTRQR